MLSFSLMPEKYVSLCFLFSFVLLDRLICNLFISYFFRSGCLFFNVIIHFVNYSCTVTKITHTRLNLVCEALSAICSTEEMKCAVCYEPLCEKMEELATSLNRLVY